MPKQDLPHVPKRATQHGIYISGEETAPPTLKPGQKELRRNGLYTIEAVARDTGESFLAKERSGDSEYVRSFGSNTVPEHYLEYSKPEVRWAKQTVGGDDASHWRSEYKSVLNRDAIEGAVHFRQTSALCNAALPPNVVGRADDETTYRAEYGRYGSNPRDRIPPGALTLPIFKTCLNAGTTKGTCFIPNYQGHIPFHPNGSASARVQRGEDLRSVDKTNVAETFHTNLVGYAGYVPHSARNDTGGRKPTNLTIAGRDFVAPNISAA